MFHVETLIVVPSIGIVPKQHGRVPPVAVGDEESLPSAGTAVLHVLIRLFLDRLVSRRFAASTLLRVAATLRSAFLGRLPRRARALGVLGSLRHRVSFAASGRPRSGRPTIHSNKPQNAKSSGR